MAYGQMAMVYDHLMAHAPYEKWVEFTEEMFKEHEKSIHHIADLGCGTGEITTLLAKKGYQIVGVDYSEEMLTLAESKAMENNVSVTWLHQDIRSLDGLENLDAAVSYCDVMNYITEPEDIKATFHNVYQSLKQDGLFLFDVHHLDYILDHYINQTFAEVTDEASYIWFCSPGEELGEMYHDLTFFYLMNEKYERFDEQHHQQTYSINFYKEILEDVGFKNVKVYADFNTKQSNIDDNTARIFFSAVK
ncbi:class I SAM-dependent methyltransferase [Oceanobacillus luteolus]|uniref:Class I SAM-dependent DNA methyltransferase n=1 Tax=Oceanobacillus luteolus TaxID=1274358 RepID=A0ABW4HX79_9BACI|nr:class I SAM-dependent methyltransferase [Oceanobacillus luteolus]MCM3738675.1 class I SAM-dependent methyltransferase [Oceanobacillus luteolus]